ncbi:type I-E CRISPR-associated protein Cas5/CasD [Schaalia sp. Marseille-Q2122]|uniref:type I-E CRISPR-associated protein Cas5/CasD n=1 Tax=Schaalia sp. Marseille-Q2122 TaxID=2736604 RepID=UPI00158C0F22|nr:type I-E CRISPR-associated protein Cas5/CasD [Schaalia sp. Marseille-Q2122]
MSTLILRLAAPMQSWGDSSRFTVRQTRREPTKSGIIGLIAAAQGRRRSDSIEDLLNLKLAVRVDQPGTLLRDFHTARKASGESMPLTYRYYLSDAVFVAAIEGERDVVEGIAESLRRPRHPLYLGRRSCPPSAPLVLKIVELSALAALKSDEVPWQAADWFRKRCEKTGYAADLVFDLSDESQGDPTVMTDVVQDCPVTFDQRHREYTWRNVGRSQVVLRERAEKLTTHDPMSVMEGK